MVAELLVDAENQIKTTESCGDAARKSFNGGLAALTGLLGPNSPLPPSKASWEV